METTASNDIALCIWATEVCTKHPNVLEHMRNSDDPMERVIAARIMKNAGVNEL